MSSLIEKVQSEVSLSLHLVNFCNLYGGPDLCLLLDTITFEWAQDLLLVLHDFLT